MRVGIISERLNRPLTGVGIYQNNLIEDFSHMPESKNVCLINFEKDENIKGIDQVIVTPPPKITLHKPYLRHAYLQLALRKNNYDLDIIHSPENASLVVCLENQKKIVTIHDIIAYLYPTTHLTWLRYKLLLKKTILSSDYIIVDSANTKKDIIKYFDYPGDNIEVIYLAAGRKFKPLEQGVVDAFRNRYNVLDPFILYVGGQLPHKNIQTLIKAYRDIRKRGIKHKLVIAGLNGLTGRDNTSLIKSSNLSRDIIYTGYLPSECLPALYNAADLLVYPSLYEGFGLPPLEAMASGCPVIASNNSSLPEVLGNAGVMVEPTNIGDLTDSIIEVLLDDTLRRQMVTKGLRRAQQFSWSKCANETYKVYQEVYLD